MDILLIDPKINAWGYSAPNGIASFGLISVATYLNHNGQNSEILDMNTKQVSWEDLPAVIKQKKPDVVGVPSSMNCYIPQSLRVVNIAKETNPNIVTLGGGINFTLNSVNIMKQNPNLDFIVRGDGEYTTLELIQAMENKSNSLDKIQGITHRNEGKVIVNPDRPPIMDLDTLPIPDWDLIDMDRYGMNAFPPQWGKQVMLTISRGCPNHCRYCAPTLAAQRYRELSAERALEIITVLRQKYDRRMIWLNDLTFCVNEERTAKLLEGIIETKLDIAIVVDMTAELVIKRQNLLSLMKRAGIQYIPIGVESPIDKDHRKYQDKAKSWDKAEDAFRLLRKNKILPAAYFMIGEVEHTAKEIRRIRELAEKLDPAIAFFCFVNPQPGTPYYEDVKDYIATDDLSCYGEFSPVMKYPHLGDNQIRMLYREIWVSYYARPTRILRRLLFGGSQGRSFYTTVAFNKKWGWELEEVWRETGWQGWEGKYDELKKWARKELGLTGFIPWLEEVEKSILKRSDKTG